MSAADPELLAFVEGIERHLRRLKGAEVVLSPEEFALARQWHGARVSLARVLAAIDEKHADGGPPRSLLYYRGAIEEPAGDRPQRATRG